MNARTGMTMVLLALSGCGGSVAGTNATTSSAGSTGVSAAAGAGGGSVAIGGAGGASPSEVGGGITATAGASSTGGGAGAGAQPAIEASLRVAHVDPSLPALDVCIGTPGKDGAALYDPTPLLASIGRSAGVVFTEVSTYVPVLTGRVVRFVPAGTGCSHDPAWPIAGAPTHGWVIAVGAPSGHLAPRITIAPSRLVGEGGAIVDTLGFVDEPENDNYGIHVRALSFVRTDAIEPAGAIDLADSDPFGAIVTWFDALPYATVPTHSPQGKVSGRGFLWRPEIQLNDLRITSNGTTFITKGKLAVPSGDGNAYGVASVFVVGNIAKGDVRAIACGDNAEGKEGLGACVVLAP